jgi:HEAT repeat protein
MLKLSPDATNRMAGRLAHGPIEQRIKALQIAHELGMAETLKPILLTLCTHPNPRVRSKAVGVMGDVPGVTPDALLESALNDTDGRVRANAIEVLESSGSAEFVPMLTQRARSGHNRERANAIKAMHRMKVRTASTALSSMLSDERSEHRISALWALRQIGWWQLINQVGQMAKTDPNLRVRRYALAVLKGVAEMVQDRKKMGA